MKHLQLKSWKGPIRRWLLGGDRRLRPHSLTRTYILATLGLVTALGVSTALTSNQSSTTDRSTAADKASTKMRLELHADSSEERTNTDPEKRHDFRSDDGLTGSTSQNTTTIIVNGETITVPENGSVNRTITSDDGNTNVNVSVENSSTGNHEAPLRSRYSHRMNLDMHSRIYESTQGSTDISIDNSE